MMPNPGGQTYLFIEEKLKIPILRQRLVFNAKLLVDDKSIGYYNVI